MCFIVEILKSTEFSIVKHQYWEIDSKPDPNTDDLEDYAEATLQFINLKHFVNI